MTDLLSSIRFVLFFLISTYGLGRLVTNAIRKEAGIGWAYTTALGVALWIVYGGVLNYLHIVSPLILLCSMYLGATITIGFACLDLTKRIKHWPGRGQGADLQGATACHALGDRQIAAFSFLGLETVVLIFSVYYLMPSDAYNFHDDFHIYLHPAKQLLTTGGFDFNLFSALGLNEMGGQLFMKTFPFLFFDFRYANTFDAIICFTLCLCLLIEFGQKIGATNITIILSAIIFLFINPQIVNTGACYSSSLMIIGIVYSLSLMNGLYSNKHNIQYLISFIYVLQISLFYSAIVTLKSTTIIFALLLFLLIFSLDLLFQKSKNKAASTNISTTIMAFFLLSPWLFAPSSKFIYTLKAKLNTLWMGSTPPAATPPSHDAVNYFLPALFSTGKLFWGNSYPDYLAILIALSIAAFLSLYGLSRMPQLRERKEVLFLPAGAVAAICSLFIFGRMIDPQTALRYATPLLIAMLPISTLIAGKYFLQGSSAFLKKGGFALIGMHLLIVGLFVGTFFDRMGRISQHRTLISFPMSDKYYNIMRLVFSKEREEQILTVQNHMEPGTNVLAWISTPFHLDFARNLITTLEVCGTIGGAYDKEIPFGVDIPTFWQFFRKQGIRYIMWEYAGPSVKNDKWYINNGAQKEFFFKNTLPVLAEYTKVIYNNNSIAVLDISELNLHKPTDQANQ